MKPLLTLFALLTPLLAAPSAPVHLTVNEGRIAPLGFHDATPTFSWKLSDSRPGAKQTAYQINTTRKGSTLWDSGKIESAQSVYIPYAGPTLVSRDQVTWKIRYWDQNGEASAWSTETNFELGLLSNSDWAGTWVHQPKKGFKAPEDRGNPVVHLRKAFALEEPFGEARLYLTAKGIVDFRINGNLVTPDAFVPGWTDYTQKIETVTYDVTDLIQKGRNILAARISDGWYAGTISKRFYGQMPELLAQLELKSADGTILKTISTDSSWSWSNEGPITMADIWHGEDYDARKELPGWDLPGYKQADSFRPVALSPLDPKIALTPKRFQSSRVIDTLTPKSVRQFPDGKVIYDLGQNMVGWITIKLPALKNRPVRISMAEMLNDDGTLYRGNYRTARSLALYTPAESGVVEYTPTFTFFGFRYVEISGHDPAFKPTLDWVRGEVIHTDFPKTGAFDSSHAKLNQLQNNILWSQRGNFLDIPTDCPQRNERYGWTGDAQVFTPVSLFNYDTHAFWMSYLETMRMEMKPDGSVPNLLPSNQYRNWINSAGWGDAAFVIPWELYVRTGDLGILHEFYPMMAKRVGYYSNRAKGGLVDDPQSFGDWLQPRPYENKPVGTDDRSGETSTRLLTTSYYAHGADLCAKAAAILGKKDDAERFNALFRESSAAAARTFFDKDGKSIEGVETQTVYILPLAFNLLPEELAQKAAAKLSERIRKDNNLLNAGFVGTSVLIPTLERYGLREQALAILFTSQYPGWFYTIDQGATTMWERWNSYTKEDGFGDDSMNSFNHYAYGAVGSFLYERLAGLAPDPSSPGYARILIQPILDKRVPLDHASATLETRYGTATCSWKKSGPGWELAVVIPPNATGKITLPAPPNRISILEGAANFTEARGQSIATVPAGTYRFTIAR